MQQPNPYAPPPQPPGGGVLDALVPTNPLAAVACWVGILSLILCGLGALLGPIALATGIISLKRGAIIQQSAYGKGSSAVRSWIGIVTGGLGTILGIVMLVMWIAGRH